MHLADIVPTRSHMRGPWNQAYDLDALRTMEQKAHYFDLAGEQRWWLSFAHDEPVFAAKVNNDRGRDRDRRDLSRSRSVYFNQTLQISIVQLALN